MMRTRPILNAFLIVTVVLVVGADDAWSAEGPLDRAADLARAGRCAEALTVLDGIPASDPLAGAALYLKARCLEEVGRGAEAAAIYESLAARLPESAPATLELRARAAAVRAGAASGTGTGTAAGPATAAVDDEIPYRPPPRAAEREGYHPATIAGYLIGAGGGVMIATGFLFAALARGHEKELEDLAINGSRVPEKLGEPVFFDESLVRIEREGRLFARLSTGLWITGGAFLTAGVLLGILGVPREPAPEERPGVDVGVEPVPAGLGVRLRVRF